MLCFIVMVRGPTLVNHWWCGGERASIGHSCCVTMGEVVRERSMLVDQGGTMGAEVKPDHFQSWGERSTLATTGSVVNERSILVPFRCGWKG